MYFLTNLFAKSAFCEQISKQPKAFILENVKGLQSISGGKVYQLILDELKKVGYKVQSKILEAKDYGTPQLRKRLFFVGVRNDIKIDFDFPKPLELLKMVVAIGSNDGDLIMDFFSGSATTAAS